MTGNTYLEMKLLKNLFSYLFTTKTKTLGKQKTSKNFPVKKSTSPFNLITLNASNLFSLFHRQTLWKDTIISVLMVEAKFLLIGLQSVLMATLFPFGKNLSIYQIPPFKPSNA